MILCEKQVELLDENYSVYLKRVPIQIGKGGVVLRTAVRAYVKRVKTQEVGTKKVPLDEFTKKQTKLHFNQDSKSDCKNA